MTEIMIILGFVVLAGGVFLFQKRGGRLSRQVLLSLVLGVLYGLLLQWGLGQGNLDLQHAQQWLDIVGGGYIHLLKMVMIPLVAISILAAVARLEQAQALGKISLSIILMLMIMVSVAALLGVFVVNLFGLSGEKLLTGSDMQSLSDALQGKVSEIQGLNFPQLLLTIIPTNIVDDLSGARSVSVIGVVISSAFAGIAALKLRQEKPEIGLAILRFIDVLQHWIMRLVKMVINLTPYGVMALIIKVMTHYQASDLLELLGFVVACYLAIFVMFIVHGVMIGISGVNPIRYYKQVWPLLTFAFVSRSSAASIPLNVETQMMLGHSEAVSNFSASFGTTMGQNGCAGVYPAMLVAMTAPMVGIDPFTFDFILALLPMIALGSLGVAGVGGGATFASLIVLSGLNFPVALVGLFIAIEPLVDMGRTALNVNGTVVAGTLTSRFLKQKLDPKVRDELITL